MDFRKFLAELKRRKVYRVAIGYAIVSWLLLQIASIVLPTINAPEWIMQAFLFLLVVGFPIAIILAWVFEISPDGIVKTSQGEDATTTLPNRKKKVFTGKLIIAVLIISVGIFSFYKFVANKASISANIDKSIAVLPFINDSPNQENLYFCNGIMEGVLDHLAKIPELTVISRTSVEQYRDNRPSLKKLADELGVEYLVEGSVQRIGNQVVILAKLIYAAEDKNLWSKKYNRELLDVFEVQANVAKSIADKLETIINSEIKERIDYEPTTNLQAYDFYLKGRDHMVKFMSDNNKLHYNSALENYNKALELDSLMATVYSEIALMYYLDFNLIQNKETNPDFYKIPELCNKALSLNPNLPKAHAVLGYYKKINNDYDGFREEQFKALDLNPNYALPYYFLSSPNYRNAIDNENQINNLKKAISLDPNSTWTKRYYAGLGYAYLDIHAFDFAELYGKKLIELDSKNIGLLIIALSRQEKYKEAEELVSSTFEKGSPEWAGNNTEIQTNYYKDYEYALELFEIYYKSYPNTGHRDHRYGLALWLSGDKVKGEELFNAALEEFESKTKLGGFNFCYDTAGINAIMGNTERALEMLANSSCNIGNGLEYYASHDPYFINLWGNPKFIEIIQQRKDEMTIIREEILRNEIN